MKNSVQVGKGWGSGWLLAFAMTLLALGGCGNCDDEVAAANELIAANQSCAVDDDCATVRANCSELEGSFCGQLAVNREAAASARWRSLSGAPGTLRPRHVHRV